MAEVKVGSRSALPDADDAPLDNSEAADLFRHGGGIKRPKKRFAVRLPEPQSALACARFDGQEVRSAKGILLARIDQS